jgi:hypothetical protein
MGDIFFDSLYQKSLKVCENKIIDDKDVICRLSQEQQVQYLKELGKLEYNKNDYKIHVYSRKIDDIEFGIYMIKVPMIKNEKDNTSISVDYFYKTSIIIIKEDEKGIWTIDNVMNYQNKNIEFVEERYNDLYNIISEKDISEIMMIINSSIDEEIAKNK